MPKFMIFVAVIGLSLSAATCDSSKKATPTYGPGPATLHVQGVLDCDNFSSGGKRTCTGTVINSSDRVESDVVIALQWDGDSGTEFGSADVNPLLPNQTSHFKIVTEHANPQLTHYHVLVTGNP